MLRDEHELRAFVKRVLTSFITCTMSSSSNVIRMSKQIEMLKTELVARVEKNWKA
jgi:hypothetical protein